VPELQAAAGGCRPKAAMADTATLKAKRAPLGLSQTGFLGLCRLGIPSSAIGGVGALS